MVKRYIDGTPYAMNIAGIERESIVDGPGVRTTIFVQGCSHNCNGCHNPETHDFNGGYCESLQFIIDTIINRDKGTRGITISGGDPLHPCNIDGTVELCRLYKQRVDSSKSIWVYTGYLYEEVKDSPVFQYIDVLVDGKFILSKKTLEIPYVGSSNQRVIDIKKTIDSGIISLYK